MGAADRLHPCDHPGIAARADALAADGAAGRCDPRRSASDAAGLTDVLRALAAGP